MVVIFAFLSWQLQIHNQRIRTIMFKINKLQLF